MVPRIQTTDPCDASVYNITQSDQSEDRMELNFLLASGQCLGIPLSEHSYLLKIIQCAPE
ncbi:unnamed protein product [Leptidea sinapis]|uniref:Uncharacterized protein n=1 Tax=Leptidea sinapis TaxID=189913 RepID=A0A5E4Q290_9NEOP|nr:unnamed protein product [Leptidea sinapis]